MKLIHFPEQTVVIAEHQKEYRPLPAFQFAQDPTGRIACCWQLTWRERIKLLCTGKLWHTVLTFHQSLQSQLLQLEKPFTPEDVTAAHAEKSKHHHENEFLKVMVQRYGEKAREKTAKMDALNYHPNDRRRIIKFSEEDFQQAQALGLYHLGRCRIVNETAEVTR